MRLSKVIALADEMKPNALSRELKIHFVSECEGMIQSDIMLLAPADIIVYEPTGSEDPELLAKPPHDKLYVSYLTAMIDFALGEYNKYANTISLYNTYLAEYTAWYADRIRPRDGRAEISGYYLSAYAIAVMHGYEGSETDWLLSLRGRDGTTTELRYSDDALEWRYEGEPDDAWRVLMTYDELRGEVVSATLHAAQSAAETSENAKSAAESAAEAAQVNAQTASSAAGSASLDANYIRQNIETAAHNAETAQKAAESAAGSSSNASEAAKRAEEYAKRAEGAAGGGVLSFNGRSGYVEPETGDYTAEMVGADTSGAADKAVKTHNESTDAHAELFKKKADLDESGKVSASQLPEMDYEASGAADSAVKTHNESTDAHAELFENKADLDESGKVLASQLPEMDYEASGAADSAVKTHNESTDAHATLFAAKLDKSGGTMTGKLVAQANTDYNTPQVRNIQLATAAAVPTGYGSLLGVYS